MAAAGERPQVVFFHNMARFSKHVKIDIYIWKALNPCSDHREVPGQIRRVFNGSINSSW